MFIKRFLKKEKFDNYDDYVQNAVPVVPENFNFAYDVLDVMANESPDKVAVLWVNDDGEKNQLHLKCCQKCRGLLRISWQNAVLKKAILYCCLCDADGNTGLL